MSKKGWGKFIVGASLGAGLALLFAPKSGDETRKELKEKAEDLLEKAKNIKIKDVQEMLEKKINELGEEIRDLDKEKVLKFAKEKGEKVKEKANEIVELAKEKGTPVLKDAAQEVREKAIKVAKETIDRLEKNEPKATNNNNSKKER